MKRAEKGLVVAWLLLSILAFAGLAEALPVLHIDIGTGSAGQGGTLVVSGGNAVGSGILIDTLTFAYEFATPTSSVYDLSGAGNGLTGSTAILDFSTGGAGGNFIKVTGGVPALGVPDDTVLLTGSFTDFTITSAPMFGGLSAVGHALKSSVLLGALGLPTQLDFDFFGFTIGLNPANQGSPYTVVSTDIVNKVPSPSMLVGLGAGLLAFAVVARRLRR